MQCGDEVESIKFNGTEHVILGTFSNTVTGIVNAGVFHTGRYVDVRELMTNQFSVCVEKKFI